MTPLRARLNAAFKFARMAYRNPREITNRYEAGRRWQWGDRSWIWSYVTDARFDADSASRIEIVRKIRHFEQNNGLVQRLADLWEQYTVGANGLTILSDSLDEDWALSADQWFNEWSTFPDLISLQNWPTLQSLIARTWFIDGEVFIIKTRGETAPYRPRIQLIEGHRVGTPPGMVTREGRDIVDGVEIDGRGRPIAYHIQTGFDASNFSRVPAENVIHIFEPSRVGMYRGLSHFYAVANQLHDLDDLELLEMKAAKEAASKTDVITTESGELPDDDAWNEQTNATPTENPQKVYYESKFGSAAKVLFKGDKYEQYVSNRPSVAQQWYWNYLGEKVCVGSAGIPLILVYPDKAQGTVYRGAIDMAAVNFKARSAVLAAAFKQIWIYVIGSASAIDKRIANKPADWTTLTTRPPRSVNVDVGRNSNAMLAELAAGTRTWQDIYAETGDDWKQKLRQRAREISFINDLAKEFKIDAKQISDVAEIPPPPPITPGGKPNAKPSE